jgi:hypothetical protein
MYGDISFVAIAKDAPSELKDIPAPSAAVGKLAGLAYLVPKPDDQG